MPLQGEQAPDARQSVGVEPHARAASICGVPRSSASPGRCRTGSTTRRKQERLLFTPAGFYEEPTRPQPDWSGVHAELRRRGVTLMLLWEEYRAEHADGYGYSRFCDLYGEWRKGVTATMRQTHVAGEKLFVDFAGDTVPVIDGLTGEIRAAHVFVAVLGCPCSIIHPTMEFGLLMKAALMVFGGQTARCSLATRILRTGSERDGIRKRCN